MFGVSSPFTKIETCETVWHRSWNAESGGKRRGILGRRRRRLPRVEREASLKNRVEVSRSSVEFEENRGMWSVSNSERASVSADAVGVESAYSVGVESAYSASVERAYSVHVLESIAASSQRSRGVVRLKNPCDLTVRGKTIPNVCHAQNVVWVYFDIRR